MAVDSKGKQGSGCLPSCGCFCGCWTVLFLLILVVAGGFLYVFGWPFWKALRTTPQFPETPRIVSTDRESLEERLVQWQSAGPEGSIELTPGEANALLARFRPVPARGLLIEHLWVVPEEGKGSLLAEGSGFFCKRLSMACEFGNFQSTDNGWSLNGWQMNAWVEKSKTGLQLGRRFLDEYLQATAGKELNQLLAGIRKIEFHADRIRIEGAAPEGLMKRQGEEK